MPDSESPVVPLRAKLVAAFCVGFLAVQLLVPVLRLIEPRPAHFGWQMYAELREEPAFWVVARDGTTRAVAVADYVGYPRLELDYLPWLPRHLCRTVPDLTAIRYQTDDASSVEESPCP